jgi:GxxExxY protein
METELIGSRIIGAAIRVHAELGPGLLERLYEICLAHELSKEGIHVVRQVTIPVKYDGLEFDEGFRLDLLVAGKVIVEIKAVEVVNPVWGAQVLSHLKLSGLELGYVINFNVPRLKEGLKRYVRSLPVKQVS